MPLRSLRLAIAAAFVLSFGAGQTQAQASAGTVPALPPIPAQPDAKAFEAAPAPWRDYLLAARAAELIADPLQRCLAYPDLPGNAWPAGHAAAHCRNHAGTPMTLAEVEALLLGGDAAGLARRMDAMERAHAGTQDELIHYFYDRFRAQGPDAARVAALWRQQDPDSAFALAADGWRLVAEASRARGGEFISQTPAENLVQMEALFAQARPVLDRAIEKDPRLLPAHVARMVVGRISSEDGDGQAAFALGKASDPGCLALAEERMVALEPRWGGSYEQMLAYANELKRTALPGNPLLANEVVAPFLERARVLLRDDNYTAEAAAVLDIAVRDASVESAMHRAAVVADNRTDADAEPWKALGMVLQEARFDPARPAAGIAIGAKLVREEPEWAAKALAPAVAAEPGNAHARYLLGAALYNADRFEAAEAQYLLAVEDGEERHATLRELVTMWMYHAGLERKAGALRARPYLDRLLREYPDDGRAWMYRMYSDGVINGVIADTVVQSFLAHADRTEPRQAELVRNIERARKP